MTLVHPDNATLESPAEAECENCGNDTFKCLLIDMGEKARITGIVCAVCDDVTIFEKATPEDWS